MEKLMEESSELNAVNLDTEMAHIIIAGVKEAGGQETDAYRFIKELHKNWIRSKIKL